MFTTLRRRLIVSYVAVVLPALLLATLVYLLLSLEYRRQDAYRQLETGIYLVAPQIESILVRERMVAAVENIQDALLQISENALSADLPAARRAQVQESVADIQEQLSQIGDVLAQRMPFAMPEGTPFTISVGQYDAGNSLNAIFVLPDGEYTPLIPLAESVG